MTCRWNLPGACAVLSLLVACAGPVGAPPATVSGATLSTPEAPALEAIYAAMDGQGGHVLKFDPAACALRILVFRAGFAARLGHNHVLAAPRFKGFAWLPAQGTAGARFDLEFRLDELEIDNPAQRAALGPAFSSVPGPEAIAGTRDHMLGESSLDAARFPTVRVHSLEIAGEGPRLAVHAQVTLHGQVRDQWVPVDVQGPPGQLKATGALVLRQSDFGIHPYSIGGGFLAVRDELVVDFELVAR